MAKSHSPKIVSANDLLEGDVVYMTAAGDWTRELAAAAVALTADEGKAMLAGALAQGGQVVGPYLADVALEDGVPRPTHFREVYRDLGPSTRLDLGRQAGRLATARTATPHGGR